ncbi:hypothetical protein AchV4_0052 [Achromobacter phage vB_AchrS_AchV4]|uniref:Uncharacterized protein n=1 Tax=Achromobacter phage vB_AchrS_AchV4 TaxID=2796514 RepID=A0A7T3U6W8_9CAUD|nr:hypothetical protein JT316_gp52 [Achromobacter phage vB_AchrS_AchV4]QPZ53305.1 hypothetical protein AchV4_0052 [Achromobacter phage vB_AchrS_AchV4]
MRGPIPIFNHDGYRLESWGNGAAYTLTRESDNASALFQGDDATRFRADFDAAFAIGREHVRRLFSDYDDIMRFEP